MELTADKIKAEVQRLWVAGIKNPSFEIINRELGPESSKLDWIKITIGQLILNYNPDAQQLSIDLDCSLIEEHLKFLGIIRMTEETMFDITNFILELRLKEIPDGDV